MRPPEEGARAQADFPVVHFRQYEDQRLPLPITRARRCLAVAVGHLPAGVHTRVCERRRSRSRRSPQRVPRAFSGSARTLPLSRSHRLRASLDAADRQQRTPIEARRYAHAFYVRPVAQRHASAMGRGGLRRRRPGGDRNLRLHRGREVLAAVRYRDDRLLSRRHPAARQYARRLSAGSGPRPKGALQSATG